MHTRRDSHGKRNRHETLPTGALEEANDKSVAN